jgi:hypothetical protein
MTMKMHVAIRSGNQPPSRTFNALAVKNACSIRSNGTMTAADSQTGHFHTRQRTKKPMTDVMTMSAVTATP